MAGKKGKQVPQLKQTNLSDSLEPNKSLEGFDKKPGQVGIHAPDSLDAIRKPKPEERETGKPYFGGVSEPKVSEQTFDCYQPIKKSGGKKSKKS